MSGAILSEASFVEAQAQKANFVKCRFVDAKFSKADLSEASFTEAQGLTKADFSYARMAGAKLGGVNLTEANLSNTDLSNADLSSANLSNADLSNADLSNADLSDCNLTNANLSNSNGQNATLPFQTLDVTASLGSLLNYTFDDQPAVFALPSGSAALRLRAVTLRNNYDDQDTAREIEVLTGTQAQRGQWTSLLRFESAKTNKILQFFGAAGDLPAMGGFVKVIVHTTYGGASHIKSMALLCEELASDQ